MGKEREKGRGGRAGGNQNVDERDIGENKEGKGGGVEGTGKRSMHRERRRRCGRV